MIVVITALQLRDKDNHLLYTVSSRTVLIHYFQDYCLFSMIKEFQNIDEAEYNYKPNLSATCVIILLSICHFFQASITVHFFTVMTECPAPV